MGGQHIACRFQEYLTTLLFFVIHEYFSGNYEDAECSIPVKKAMIVGILVNIF